MGITRISNATAYQIDTTCKKSSIWFFFSRPCAAPMYKREKISEQEMCFSQFLIPINSCFLHQDRFFLHVSRIFLLLGSLPRFSYMDLSFSFWNTQNVMSLWPSCCSYQMEIHITHSGSLINITRARTSFFLSRRRRRKKATAESAA